jgi:hypothetical protein
MVLRLRLVKSKNKEEGKEVWRCRGAVPVGGVGEVLLVLVLEE